MQRRLRSPLSFYSPNKAFIFAVMNIHLKVLEWSNNGRVFGVGAAILEEAIASGYRCASIHIIRASVKSGKVNTLSKSKLSEALNDVSEKFKPEEKKTVREFGFVDPDKLPDDLVAKQEKIRVILKTMDMLRGQLRLIYYTTDGKIIRNPNESQGLSIAAEIQSSFLRMKSMFPEIDYFREFGRRMPGTGPVSVDQNRLIYLLKVQLQNADYLSKCRTKMKKGLPINQLKYDECAAIEREIKALIK